MAVLDKTQPCNMVQVKNFCGAEVLPTFSFFDVIKDPQINPDIECLKQQIAEIFE